MNNVNYQNKINAVIDRIENINKGVGYINLLISFFENNNDAISASQLDRLAGFIESELLEIHKTD